jgi:hypothetical protein
MEISYKMPLESKGDMRITLRLILERQVVRMGGGLCYVLAKAYN